MATSPPSDARVVVAIRQAAFREAMSRALDAEPGVRVTAEAADGSSAVAAAARADVAVIQSDLGGGDGVQTACVITSRAGACRVVMLASDQNVDMLAECVKCGARAFLTEDCGIAEVAEAVRSVHRGETLVPPQLLGSLLSRLMRQSHHERDARERLYRLTRRERQVLVLISRAADTTTIARTLVISPETARTHVQNILGKLGVHSRLEAAAFVTNSDLAPELKASLPRS